MDSDYQKKIIDAAIQKLKIAKKPLADNEFTRGIVAILKKTIGKDDKRHSSKIRFRKEYFKFVVEKTEWKEFIIELEDKRFSLKEWVSTNESVERNYEWNWEKVDFGIAQHNILKILKKIDPYKFENLIKELVEELYEVEAEVTSKSGDMGIDIIGYKQDDKIKDKKQALYVQVKRFDGTVIRDYADKFIGAVEQYHNKEKWTRFDGLFVTSGKLPDSFRQKLRDSSRTGINFECWDGNQLVLELLKLGWGVNYSIDIDFWLEHDSAIVPKELTIK